MNKKTRRIVSISIGIILSLLIVFIGFRIMQRSGAQAAPEDLSCDRNKTTARVQWTDGNGDPATVVYGSNDSTALPFLAKEKNSPENIGIGQFKHRVDIGPLPPRTQYSVAVEGFTSQTANCTGDDGTESVLIDTTSDSADTLDALLESQSDEDEPEEPEPEPTAEPTDEPSKALPGVEAREYFNDNPDKSILDCIRNFGIDEDENGNQYTGLQSTCAAAWTNVNLSSSN